MTPLRPSIVLVSLLLLPAPPSPARAAEGKWAKDVERLEELLGRKDWKGVLDRAVKVRASMAERAENGGEVVAAMAETLALQALAEANLGRDDDALWHWQAAQNWLEGLDKKDLSAFARAKEVLAPGAMAAPEGAVPAAALAGHYQPVKIRQTLRPVFPISLRKSGKQGKVRVRLLVGTDGRPRQPVVLAAGVVPAMACNVLEALGRWRFEPASYDRKPVAVVYELEVSYP